MERPLNKLPLDFCRRLAAMASPGSLQSLCLVSKAAYKFFNLSLYEVIDEPKKVGKLLMTLGSEKRVGLGAHPASLVRDLRIYYCVDQSFKYTNGPEEKKKKEAQIDTMRKVVLRALDSTARTAGGRSRLRKLWFTSNVGVEDIGPLFLKRARFPCLEHLRVLPPRDYGKRKNFQFLTIPGLKTLQYEEEIHYERDAVSYNAFSTSIKCIPSSSPHLHTLKLKFECFGLWNMHKEQSEPDSIVSVINTLRLPCLRIVEIEIELCEVTQPMDFRPFLSAHPSLHDISIDLQGRPLEDVALPNLRSFGGSPVDCITVCNGRRPIESLKLLLLEPKFNLSLRGRKKEKRIGTWGDEYVWDEDAVLNRLAATPTLRRLYLNTGTSHPDEDPQFEERGLYGSYVERIAKSCPHLTHLELHVAHGMLFCCDSIVRGFVHLEWLKLHLWEDVKRADPMIELAIEFGFDDDFDEEDLRPADATDHFPAGRYAEEVEKRLAPELPKLEVVELDISGNQEHQDEYREDDEFGIVYTFLILRDGGEVEARLINVEE